MTEQQIDATDAYGRQLGPELRALADRAIPPYDAAAIAHAVTVGRAPRRRWIGFRVGWLRGLRPLVLAILVLVTALVFALWAGVGQQQSPPATFAPGSIAFTRGGDLYVAAPDGSGPTRVVESNQPSGDGIRRFAFSPDRRYLAFNKHEDPTAEGDTLNILSPDGTTSGIYTWGGNPPGTSFVGGLKFAWSPDGSRLAVYPGATDAEIAIVGIDGDLIGVLRLPVGVSVTTVHEQFFAVLSWSPDSTWLAVAVQSGGDVSPCTAGDDAFGTCYIFLATDGSSAQAASDDPSGYLAWAPDSRAAITHFAQGTIEIRPTDGSAAQVIALPTSVKPGDGHVVAWSADGTRLAVTSLNEAPSEEAPPGNTLFVIEGDGTVHPAPINLFTGSGSNITDICWSMDPQRLLFSGLPSGGSQAIWSIDVDGGTPTRLVNLVDGRFDVADGRP